MLAGGTFRFFKALSHWGHVVKIAVYHMPDR